MAKIIHSMVRVMDEAKSVAFYDKAFGLKIADRLDFPDFTLIYLNNPESTFELELTVNKGRTEPYQQGNAYGHLAVTVDDLESEHKRISDAGLAPGDIKHMQHNGKPLGSFFFITDPDGYKIEVLQRAGRFL